MQNPFSQFRAENMGHDLWKLYVPGPFRSLLTPRPLVLEGGRGSGKTMFFLCNSWEQQIKMQKANAQPIADLLSEPHFVGLYYKVDTAFVGSMEGRGFDQWDGVFSTYIGICLGRELLLFLNHLVQNENMLRENDLQPVLRHFARLVGRQTLSSVSMGLEVCDDVLDNIEKLINNPSQVHAVEGTATGRFLNKVVQAVRSIPSLAGVCFRVFIDEYETFLTDQQRLVNTLIKHSSAVLVYNIGLRPKGMLTPRTSGSSEIIQAPHDFTRFRLEMNLLPGEGSSTESYLSYLKEVCAKRIQHFALAQGHGNIPTDIEFYLGRYDLEDEVRRLTQANRRPSFVQRLEQLIELRCENKAKLKYYSTVLAIDVEPYYARLHLCLLLRSNRYRPSLEVLTDEYLAWKSGKVGTKYSTWLHNARLGLVFLLAREYRQPKLYYGADVFAMLSSGVIRYFLELCEQAFESAIRNGFTWTIARAITPDEQSSAARYVASYKINDIGGYEPYARTLRIFVENLGNTFSTLHSHRNTTLGEPEPNHFCTSDLMLKEDDRKILNSGVMWAVLQERGVTKEKDVDQPNETVDYHLNHIYCPYFDISYRQKRKVNLSAEEVNGLLCGNAETAKAVAAAIQRSRRIEDSEDPVPFRSLQLTFLDGESEND